MSKDPRSSACSSLLPYNSKENARHEQTEWKDRRDHRWRYRHRPRRSKALHRGGRLRLHLRPPAEAERGTLDIVFANAGVGSQLRLGETLQRMGDPAEIGAAAAFLASSDSSFMTASEVAVDGGLAQL